MKTDTKTNNSFDSEQQKIITSLTKELQSQQKIITEKNKQLRYKDVLIDKLQYQLKNALGVRFGSKSEKLNTSQRDLFNEAESTSIETTEVITVDEALTTPSTPHKKPGRKRLPSNLPRIQHIHDLSDAEKICDCGCALSKIGEETTEQLEYIPAQVRVIENVRIRYACKQCEANVKLSPLPKQPIPKSIATPGLLSQILVAKYEDHLPLYRQEHILNRHGIDIARGTLCHWVIKCGELLKPLVKLLEHRITHYDVAYADETPVQVLKEKNRPPTSKSFLWLFMGGPPTEQCIVYRYHPTRSGEVPREFFHDFQGFLHVDAFSGYANIPNTKIVGCWAHARRKFMSIVKTKPKSPGLAHEAVEKIQKLYLLEKQFKEKKLSIDEIKTERQLHTAPLLHDFKRWLDQHAPKTPAQSHIHLAIQYGLNHWNNLLTFLSDGRLEIDNNKSERAIKPCVIGRKNWLFADSPEGMDASTVIYSLIETAKVHQHEPYFYLKHVLTHIPNCDSIEELEKLLPFNLKLD